MLAATLLNYFIKENLINNFWAMAGRKDSIKNSPININENVVVNNNSILTYCILINVLKDLKEKKIPFEYNLINIYEKYNYFDEKLIKIDYTNHDLKDEVLGNNKTFEIYLGVFDVSYNAVKVKKDMFSNFIEKNTLKDLIF